MTTQPKRNRSHTSAALSRISRCGLWTIAALLLASPQASAVEAVPRAISPGESGGGEVAVATTRCPTFIWIPAAAESQRLDIYEVDPGSGEVGAKVLTRELPSRAGAWAPSLGECLVAGGTYAWTVGAVRETAVAWSRPVVFEVPATPTPEELQAALDVLARHRGQNETGATSPPEPTTNPSDVSARRATVRRDHGGREAETVASHASGLIGPTALKLDGQVHVATGDSPTLRLDQDDSVGNAPQTWDLTGNEVQLYVRNANTGTIPLKVHASSPTDALRVDDLGITVGGRISCTDCIGTTELTDQSVAWADIKDGAITSGKIKDESVQGNDILNGTIESADIKDGTIGTLDIADASITQADLAANSVGGIQIIGNSVGTAKLQDDAVIGRVFADPVAVRVECDGECGDSDLGAICNFDLAIEVREPIAVSCRDVNAPGSSSGCGGDNVCAVVDVDLDTSLGTLCNDVSGWDAIVYCN